jgi:large-conductance mechanosensitive channel
MQPQETNQNVTPGMPKNIPNENQITSQSDDQASGGANPSETKADYANYNQAVHPHFNAADVYPSASSGYMQNQSAPLKHENVNPVIGTYNKDQFSFDLQSIAGLITSLACLIGWPYASRFISNFYVAMGFIGAIGLIGCYFSIRSLKNNTSLNINALVGLIMNLVVIAFIIFVTVFVRYIQNSLSSYKSNSNLNSYSTPYDYNNLLQ